jgi:hypothetical protein
MPNWKSIVRSCPSSASQKRILEGYLSDSILMRESALDNWYKYGGDVFIAWLKENYRLADGKPMRWDEPYLEDFFRVFANPWLEKLIVCKPAQVGYTETLVGFCAFSLAYLRSPIALGFEERNKLYSMVGKRIQPVFDNINAIQDLKKQRHSTSNREDIDSKQSITVGSIALELFYAKIQSGGEDEQAASVIRSFTACGILVDEFGLCPPETLDVAEARMEKSFWKIPFSRAGSTPGVEGGTVDTAVRQSNRIFEWQVQCHHCQSIQILDAFGNFLRPAMITEEGVSEEKYVDKMGRPYSWFHHSENPEDCKDGELQGIDLEQAFKTAYVGCRNCGNPLNWDIDIAAGEFVCTTDNRTTLKSLLAIAQKEQKPIRESWAITLPKLASLTFKPEVRIRAMFRTRKPGDGIQQFLGKAITLGGGKITSSRLQRCISIPVPNRKPDLVLGGVDQGRYGHWLLIANFWYGEEGDKYTRWETGHKEIFYWGSISDFSDLDKFAEEYQVNIFGCDQEPEYNDACKYAILHPPTSYKRQGIGQVYLMDQMGLQGGEQFRRTVRNVRKNTALSKRRSRDNEVAVYIIDRTFGLDATRDRIFRDLQTFPKHATYTPKDDNNIFYHYTTSDRLPNNTWKEPAGVPDHYHHCDSFIEMAALACLTETGARNQKRYTGMPIDLESTELGGYNSEADIIYED